MSTTDDLTIEDAVLLNALVAEYNAATAVAEQLRARLEGLTTATQMLRNEGLKCTELHRRVFRATELLIAADRSKRDLKEASDMADQLDSHVMRLWQRALADLAEARDEMISVCFGCDTSTPVAAPKVYEVVLVRHPWNEHDGQVTSLYVDNTLRLASTDLPALLDSLDGEPCRIETRKLWPSPWLEKREDDHGLPAKLSDIPDDAYSET